MTPRSLHPGGDFAAWLARGPDDAPCRELCARQGRGESCDPVPGRPVSWDGIGLCLRFCRGFAARRNAMVVRRPRRRTSPSESAT